MKSILIPLLALSLLTLGAYGQPAGPGGPPSDLPKQPETNPTTPPEGPVPRIPEEVLELRAEVQNLHQNLARSRREALLALGEDPSEEAVRNTLEAWRSENAADLVALDEMAESFRNALRENRPDRADVPENAAAAKRREASRANIADVRNERAALGSQLGNPDLSPAEREELVQEFRDNQRALAAERRHLERQERAEQVNTEAGERRPGD